MLLRDNNITILESTNNPAIGVMEGVKYNSKEIQFQPNDLLLMFTDGVSEAQNLENEEFGEKRIEEVILINGKQSPKDLNSTLFASLENFRGNAEQFDDITIYSFRYIG
jgi:sigma-B regulation protein RsbU (phosphoserine phosphatase)